MCISVAIKVCNFKYFFIQIIIIIETLKINSVRRKSVIDGKIIWSLAILPKTSFTVYAYIIHILKKHSIYIKTEMQY